MAPPGICPISATIPPIDSTRPISTWVHFCVVRYTATNGPKPVCTSARKKMNQSSPRRLCRDGDDGRRDGGSGGRNGSPSPPIDRIDARPIGCLGERANRLLLRNVRG